MSTIFVLVLMSFGSNAQLPGSGWATRADCESVGIALLNGLRWACVEVVRPAVLS